MIRQPDVIPHSKGIYILDEDYSYTWVNGNLVYTIVIKKGYKYDGASSPRITWTFSGILPDGLIRPAALIHDALYEKKGIFRRYEYHKYIKLLASSCWDEDVRPEDRIFSRKQCDKIFLDIMELAGVGKTDRLRTYWAVRLFGWWAWRKKK